MENFQWLANFGVAAIFAGWLLFRFDKTIAQLTRQVRLNTIVLARISGLDYEEIKRDFDANGQ